MNRGKKPPAAISPTHTIHIVSFEIWSQSAVAWMCQTGEEMWNAFPETYVEIGQWRILHQNLQHDFSRPKTALK